MPIDFDTVRYQKSTPQVVGEWVASHDWGTFIRYFEFGDDCFAVRQVDVYENGNVARYDRVHWEDQFGSLADFRFDRLWIKHWGQPIVITREEFDDKWNQAEKSSPYQLRRSSPEQRPPWIELFESGCWQGQE